MKLNHKTLAVFAKYFRSCRDNLNLQCFSPHFVEKSTGLKRHISILTFSDPFTRKHAFCFSLISQEPLVLKSYHWTGQKVKYWSFLHKNLRILLNIKCRKFGTQILAYFWFSSSNWVWVCFVSDFMKSIKRPLTSSDVSKKSSSDWNTEIPAKIPRLDIAS